MEFIACLYSKTIKMCGLQEYERVDAILKQIPQIVTCLHEVIVNLWRPSKVFFRVGWRIETHPCLLILSAKEIVAEIGGD